MRECTTGLARFYRERVAKKDWVELFAVEDGRSSIMVGASVLGEGAGRNRDWEAGPVDDGGREDKL